MDLNAYSLEAEIEERHWWFVGRRRLFARLLADLAVPREAAILDVGTSTGTNLRLLKGLGYSKVTGVDSSPRAVEFCSAKGLGPVELGDVCNLPFPDGSFDIIFATDIIEHVDNDMSALRELNRVLKPSGRVLITVPAFQLLWGVQDEVGHHKRRYRLKGLVDKVLAAGFRPLQQYYFNYLLFVPILAVRLLLKVFRFGVANENQLTTPLMNRILLAIFTFDVGTAHKVHPPFGVSCLVLVEREQS